ncbi:MAG TPA: hypothetical protein GX527_09310 [Clostridiaceae bacterium]|jgi:sugar (pentulose or hexulose) kinase|nr:hypothetical protein [Clostridiaceae bacterium]
MYILGIDVGTTGTKCILIDEKGNVLKSAYESYGLIKSSNNIVEQKADDWWNALVSTVKECTNEIIDKGRIKALSISSQGGSLLPVDENGNPLSNVIVWMDKRGIKQQSDLLKLHTDEFYYKKTGWKLSAGGNMIQIRWLKENSPDIFCKTHKFLSTIDYINYKLTGNYIIDPTNAAMTNLIDVKRGVWDDDLLSAAGISEERLAKIMEPGEVVGELTLEAAEQLRLNTSLKVINGGHDQYCAAIGTGSVNEGQLFLSAGTAWVLLGIFNKPIFNTNTYIAPGRHIVKDLWGALVSVPTGGISMEWFKDNFGATLLSETLVYEASIYEASISQTSEDKILYNGLIDKELFETPSKKMLSESLKDIDKKASILMERAKNVYFYPYYNGSGYPYYNKNVKATLTGLGLEHDRYDMALAIMEGIAFEVNHAIEEFRERGCKLKHLRMIGGGSKSDLWTDIITNVTGTPVIRLKEAEAACIGASIIAGVGCGVFKDYDDACKHIVKDEIVTAVDTVKRDFYKSKYEKYKQGIKFIESYYQG